MSALAKNQSSFETFGQEVKKGATETVDAAARNARNMGSAAVEAVDTAAANVGEGIENMSKQVRKNLPNDGYVGSAAGAVADTMEKTGKYLETGGVSGIAEDFTALIKANPIPAVLIGIGIGFLLARSSRG